MFFRWGYQELNHDLSTYDLKSLAESPKLIFPAKIPFFLVTVGFVNIFITKKRQTDISSSAWNIPFSGIPLYPLE